mmetsp:Transcript_19549/g.43555  ORF Transcript_19549/g.43555 Transcript_19549/m.43555 type:complete len:536 (-) Transcript_19549:414-2021(-)
MMPKTPRNIEEALALAHKEQWKAALDKELADCVGGNSYAGVDEKPARYMNSVMSFRVSVKADGSYKFRVRLCPDGSKQEKGKDFRSSFSPIVRKETVFMVMHVSAAKDWGLLHIGIGCAYKEAIPDLEKPLYMKVAKDLRAYGFSKHEFVQLLVNYWGTKDAGRKFYAYLAFILTLFGLERSGGDPCLFIQVSGLGQRVIALLYVDDIAVTGDWKVRIVALLDHLRSHFSEIKCEDLTKFLGMQCIRDRGKKELRVHLSDYAKAVVIDHVPDDIPGSTTPLFATVEYRGLAPGTEAPIWVPNGKARFMADSSWPELKVATSVLASAGATPQKVHRRGMMKALTYIKQHQDHHFLVLGGEEPVVLFCFCDSAYSPEGDSKYQYGHVEYLSASAGAVITLCKRSKTVSHSSAQSEVKAMSEACKVLTADRPLLVMPEQPQAEPSVLYTDSQAGVDLISNVWEIHPRCRHFNRDINHVRECVQLGIVSLVFVPTDDTPADIMTKVLGPTKHIKFTEMLLRGVGVAEAAAMAVAGWKML